MGSNVEFFLVDCCDIYRAHRANLMALLAMSAQDEAILGFDDRFTGSNVSKYADSLAYEIAMGTLQLVLGRTSDQLVFCYMLKRSHQQTTQHICDLQKGFIHPEYRGKILKRSLAYIAQVCIENGVELITLDVRENTRAHKMWEMCGFETYGVLPDYSRYQGISYEGHFMKQSAYDLLQRFKLYI